jgi:hypothetical protein
MICPGCILAGIAIWYALFWDKTKAWVSKKYKLLKGEEQI